MARLTQAPRPRSVSGVGLLHPDSLADLTRLLSRLQQSILYPDAERERRLRTSEYERNKAGTNLEYARTLLTRLEQDALNIKIHNRRQELQADLNRKRDVFEQLTERLREIEDISINSDEDDDTDDTEDLLSSIVMTPSESANSRDAEGVDGADGGDGEHQQEHHHDWDMGHDDDNNNQNGEERSRDRPSSMNADHEQPQAQVAEKQDQQSKPSETEQTTQADTSAARTSTQTLQQIRSRRPAGTTSQQTTNDNTAQTTSSTTNARAQLFAGRTAKSGATTELSTTATTEAILDHQRAEQDVLTENMVRMGAALKKSAQAFATSLEQEKDVLDAAGRGLERNELGLEGASRRMGAIRKMSEGQGWLGRMKLYAMIFGMAVLAILLVFAMPKLRF